jgi:hypothetical protein
VSHWLIYLRIFIIIALILLLRVSFVSVTLGIELMIVLLSAFVFVGILGTPTAMMFKFL